MKKKSLNWSINLPNKNMFKMDFELPAQLKARVTSGLEIEPSKQNEMLARAYTPGLEVVDGSVEYADIRIDHRESEDRKLLQDDGHLTVCDQWRDRISFDIYHLLYSVSRIEFLKRNLFSVHSACTKKADDHTLIVGHSGSGKTTTAIDLVQRHGQRMVSGNKTLVEFHQDAAMRVIAGTPTITIRQSDRGRYENVIGENVCYYDRMAFELNREQYTKPFGGDIKKIAVVRLHDGLKDCRRLREAGALHALYPYFLDTVNANTIVCDGNDVFVGNAPLDAPKKLLIDLGRALAKIEVYSVAGPLSFVSDSIANL